MSLPGVNKVSKVEGTDKGYSWVVAFSCCFLIFVISGITRTSGIFYVQFIEVYGVTREEATFPFTLRGSVRNVVGPIVGILGHHFGVRKITFLGTLIAASGVIFCFLVNDIWWVSILWGGVSGTGFGMCTILLRVSLNQYFLKYRATASGIAFSGGCFGSFVMPIVLDSLLNEFGLRGSFLILGGILLNAIPAALLLRPPSWLKNRKNATPNTNEINPDKPLEVASEIPPTPPSTPFSQSPPPDWKSQNSSPENSSKGFHNKAFNDSPNCVNGKQPLNPDNLYHVNSKDLHNYITTKSLNDSRDQNIKPKKLTQLSRYFMKLLILLVDPMFVLISLTQAAWALTFTCIITVIVDVVMDHGVSHDRGKYIISILAVGDLVGRLCLGWITDKELISKRNFMMISLIGMGVVVLSFPFANSFNLYLGLSVLYGIGAGSVLMILSPVLAHYLLQEQQSHAVGMVGLLSGALTFTLPFLIGHFRDNIGSYDGIFFILGGSCVAIGFCWLLEPVLVRLQVRHRRRL